jgi:hypothetical protein
MSNGHTTRFGVGRRLISWRLVVGLRLIVSCLFKAEHVAHVGKSHSRSLMEVATQGC